jgi:hypothetical protein
MAGKKKANTEKPAYKVGDRIEALYEGQYYDAIVTKIHENGTYDVDFEGTMEGANDVEDIQKREGGEKKKKGKKSTPEKNSAPKGMSLSKQFLQVEADASPKRSTRGAKTSPVKSSPTKGKQSLAKAKQPAAKVSAKTTAKPTPQKESPKTASKKTKSEPKWEVGDTVEALWDADGFYYDAKVDKVNNGKNGVTYDLRFIQDNVVEKGRKPSQIQGVRNNDDDSSSSESEEGSESEAPVLRKKKDVDTEYTGAGGVVFAEDYVVNDSDNETERRGNGQSDDDSRDNRRSSKNPSNKRKRVATKPQQPNKIPKKRRDDMIDNLTKLRKDEILDLIYDILDKKPVIGIADLEKGIASTRNLRTK